MANNEFTIPIPARLKNVAKGGHVAGAKDIIDDALGKEQSVINQEVSEAIEGNTEAVAAERQRAVAAEGALDTRLSDVEELAEISIDGGEAKIATGEDFNNPTAEQRAKVTTVGAILDGINTNMKAVETEDADDVYIKDTNGFPLARISEYGIETKHSINAGTDTNPEKIFFSDKKGKRLALIDQFGIHTVSDIVNVTMYSNLVSNNIWTEAIQHCLDEFNFVYIPYKPTPYIIDDRLLVNSDAVIIADRYAEIKLANYTYTCFLRNKNMFASTHDKNITIIGGVWNGNRATNTNTIADDRGNGWYCLSDKTDATRGVSGLFSMMGVENFKILDVTFKETASFAIHCTDCKNFSIGNVYMAENCFGDGIHITGSCEFFHIHDIQGAVNDDLVALNSWDWWYSTSRYGIIQNGVVENLIFEDRKGVNDTGQMFRILGGKVDGVDYLTQNITIRNLKGVSRGAWNCITVTSGGTDNTPGHTDNRSYRGYLKNINFEDVSINMLSIGNPPNNRRFATFAADFDGLSLNSIVVNDDTNQSDVILLAGNIKGLTMGKIVNYALRTPIRINGNLLAGAKCQDLLNTINVPFFLFDNEQNSKIVVINSYLGTDGNQLNITENTTVNVCDILSNVSSTHQGDGNINIETIF